MIRLCAGLLCLSLMAGLPVAQAQDLKALEKGLVAVDEGGSAARQRLALRRVIRDGEELLVSIGDKPERWGVLEFLFRARQRLVSMDEDAKHRQALIEICRLLVKAPDAFAAQRLEADLLLSQVEQAKKGLDVAQRSDALRAFVSRYVGTPAGAKALRAAIVMGLEMGDTRLVNDLRKITAEHYSSDLEMITFLRDHLGGQVFGVPFVGHFKRSDGKIVCFPMDGLGHSSMVIFWSKDNENVLQYLTDMAAAWKLDRETVDGRLEIISVNLDELPDAGESIIRGVGADWQCLHFPGGRDNPIYKAYVRTDPLNLRVAPTGQAAMVMLGTTRERKVSRVEELQQQIKEIRPSEDLKGYTESFRRTLIRGWSGDEYAKHLSALMTGDFLVFDPQGFEATMPPELEAAAKGGRVNPLKRSADCVPEEALEAIQDCLIAPPMRYHASIAEIRDGYRKMRELCRKTMAEHPDAPDLWIVRNRLIIAELGLWKTDFDLAHFEAAVAEARAAMAAGYPEGCDVIARFTLARLALRDPEADEGGIIDAYVADQGGESASGPVFATASLLALDVAHENRYQKHRDAILAGHTEYPMMWLYTSFLLNREREYWMFQVPFTAGWSFGRREKYEMNKGEIEVARRFLKAELPTADGKVLRIPEDLKAEYTAIYLSMPGPWRGRDREDTRPRSPADVLRNYLRFTVERADVDLWAAMLADADADEFREGFLMRGMQEQVDPIILKLPGGMNHPLVHRLGLLSDQGGMVMLDKQGRILTVLTGSVLGNVQSAMPNTVHLMDEQKVLAAIEKGDLEAAKKLVMEHVPPYDPEAKDERGRRLPDPKYGVEQLRTRLHYFMAIKDWDKALQDAEAIAAQELASAGGMSLRTPELDAAEALRDEIKAKMNGREP